MYKIFGRVISDLLGMSNLDKAYDEVIYSPYREYFLNVRKIYAGLNKSPYLRVELKESYIKILTKSEYQNLLNSLKTKAYGVKIEYVIKTQDLRYGSYETIVKDK